MDKYQRQKVIGKGSYGQAVVVKRKADGALLVVKEVRLQGLKMEERREARAECELLSRLRHPNIVQYVEHFEQRQVLYIAMEFAEKGDLDGMLKRFQKQHGYTGKGLAQDQALHYFAQICMAMRYLHEKKILHRDIKCANIFLTASNVVKIGDFGISTILRNTFALARTVCGTPYYFSPELCQNRPYNNKSDVWAIGCVLYQFLTLRHPFDGQNMKQLMQRIVKGTPAPISTTYDSEMKALLTSMLQKNDKVRPNVGQILALPIMRQALERLQQGLGVASVKQERLPNFRDMLHADAQPKGQKKAPSPTRPNAAPPRGADPRPGVRGRGVVPDNVAAKREREKELERKLAERKAEAARAEKKLEAEIAERAKHVARWHQQQQQAGKPPGGQPPPAGAGAGARGRDGSPAPANRRRVSAPVSPSQAPLDAGPAPAQRARASPRAVDHGRRKLDAEAALKEKAEDERVARRRETEYEAKQRDRREAVNHLLLNEQLPSKGDGPSPPGSRPASSGGPSSPPAHGRRSTAAGLSEAAAAAAAAAQKKFEDPAVGVPQGREREGEGGDAEDEEDEEDDVPENEAQRGTRVQQYKEMQADIEKALTIKPGEDEDFDEGAELTPGGGGGGGGPQPSGGGDGGKFMLAGATLRLDVPQSAPMSQRLEVLRQYIDDNLGTDVFVKAYKMISELDNTAEVLASVDKLLGEGKMQLTPLICQLVFCDDQVNSSQ